MAAIVIANRARSWLAMNRASSAAMGRSPAAVIVAVAVAPIAAAIELGSSIRAVLAAMARTMDAQPAAPSSGPCRCEWAPSDAACRLRFSGCDSSPSSTTTRLIEDGFAFEGCRGGGGGQGCGYAVSGGGDRASVLQPAEKTPALSISARNMRRN